MSVNPLGITGEDLRKAESKEAQFNDGKTPKDSDVSVMKVKSHTVSLSQTVLIRSSKCSVNKNLSKIKSIE